MQQAKSIDLLLLHYRGGRRATVGAAISAISATGGGGAGAGAAVHHRIRIGRRCHSRCHRGPITIVGRRDGRGGGSGCGSGRGVGGGRGGGLSRKGYQAWQPPSFSQSDELIQSRLDLREELMQFCAA